MPVIYNKPFLDETQLLQFLKSKQLPIQNEEKAKQILKNISYYRFKSYLHPFKDDSTKMFDGSKTFEDIEKLYRFDDELRDKLFTIIGRIEIKLRSKLNYIITKHTNDPFWYLNQNLFVDTSKHSDLLVRINDSFSHCKDEYAVHFKSKYINDKNQQYCNLPPFWIVAEVIMFGELDNIYKNIKKDQFIYQGKNLLDNLAQEFGAKNLAELNRWLVFIKVIRNRCAHHSRVWNTNYFAPKGIYNSDMRFHRLKIRPSNYNRVYSFFAILNIMIKSLSIDIDVKNIIIELIDNYPIFDEMKTAAGFPLDWENDIFWN
jgi:abortive infection bacteriophage resistance protein|tara:strand:- start:1247 stop:2194 length:948 start_codon:yes stop_codon:yes gene_type:complete